MKTYPLISFLAAAAAFAFSPLNFELAVSLLFGIGLGCVVLHDYTPEMTRLRT
jgi:hypothetical protein